MTVTLAEHGQIMDRMTVTLAEHGQILKVLLDKNGGIQRSKNVVSVELQDFMFPLSTPGKVQELEDKLKGNEAAKSDLVIILFPLLLYKNV